MTIWRMHIVCWIPKATNPHSEYVILIVFHYNSGCTNTLQCYIKCTLPVLSFSSLFQVDITVRNLLSLVLLAVLVD